MNKKNACNKFDLLMRMHFPKLIDELMKKREFVTGDEFRCEVCEDFLEGHCPGESRVGKEVADCMLQKMIVLEDMKSGLSYEH